MGHVKSRVNLRGPPRKAKYSWMTDSETVPRGKGEKNPGRGSEIEHETISLQAVGERFNVWLRSCWRMSRRLIGNGLVKVVNTGAIAKASLKRAFVIIYRPEPGWSNHGQVEA